MHSSAITSSASRVTAIPDISTEASALPPGNASSAALACILKEDRALIPDLIGLLEDPEAIVGRAAYTALKTLSGKDLGPASSASASERAAAIREWRAWWSKQGSR